MTQEAKSLFYKPMDELREAFVRGRFAQANAFGRPDVEEWLAGQREIDQPELEPRPRGMDPRAWNTFRRLGWVCDIGLEATVPTLLAYATPSDLPNLDPARHPDAEQPIQWSHFVPFLRVLSTAQATPVLVYYGHEAGAIVLLTDVDGTASQYLLRGGDNRPGLMDTMSIVPFTRNLAITSEVVVDVLFAEWLYRRPKWSEARQFICDAFDAKICAERAKAEADFDTAVAVSADGTKICTADYVCVLGGSEHTATDYLYPADAFRENKLLLAPRSNEDTFRNTWSSQNTSVESVFEKRDAVTDGMYGFWWYRMEFAYTRSHHPKQSLLCCVDGRILFVHRDQCPDPLPEGGVEMTV